MPKLPDMSAAAKRRRQALTEAARAEKPGTAKTARATKRTAKRR